MADKVITTFPQGEAAYSKVLGVNAQGEVVLIKTEDIALNSGNLVPTTQRLDANEEFGTDTTSAQWSSFQNAALTVVDDYVNIGGLNPANQYTGVRADGILGLMAIGEDYVISFEYKSNKTVLFCLTSLGSGFSEVLSANTEWEKATFEITMSSTYTRVQIGKNATTHQDGDYIHLRNFTIKPKIGIDISDFKNNNFFKGKKLSIIGDSISTAEGHNAVQLKVLQSDIDNSTELKAYPTKYDIGKTYGGTEVTAEMVGSELTFTPVAADLGKEIGAPLNYGNEFDTIWWNQVANYFGMNVLANVSWSGASISSHEGDKDDYKTSYAWHPAQIAKLAQRNAEGVLETPDVVIVYRGTNDLSHSPYSKLGTFSAESTAVPQTDVSGNDYNFKDAYAILISKIREAYPKAVILICTLNVFKRITYDHFPTRNGVYTLPQLNNAIREVANAMGVGLIEFDKDGITFENCYSEGYITDSATTPTHPNAKGHTQMAKKAVADMQAYITSL